jgi:hypothetical protein
LVVHLRAKLNHTRKEDKTGVVFFGQIKSLADKMTAAGKPLDDEDIILHILFGLEDEYDGFLATIIALIKAEKVVTMSDVYPHLMAYEGCLEARICRGEGAGLIGQYGDSWQSWWLHWSWTRELPKSSAC